MEKKPVFQNKQEKLDEWHCLFFANLFNIWFNRRELDFPTSNIL